MTSHPDLSTVTTRGQLLRRADEAIQAADTQLTSVRRVVPVLLWSIGLMAMVFAQSGSDLTTDDSAFALLPAVAVLWWIAARLVPGKTFIGHLVAAVVVLVVGAAATPAVEDIDGSAARTFFLAVWAVLALGTGIATWSYVRTSRRLITTIDSWRSARRDPQLRDLDDTDVTPDIATVHDLRDRADFDDVVNEVLGRTTARQFEFATLKPVFLLMITGVLGLAFLLAPLVGLDDSPWSAANAVSGLLLLVPWAWASVIDMNRAILGRQTESNQVTAESRLYAIRRHHTSGAVLLPTGRPSLLGSPAGLFLLVAWIGVLVSRLRSSSTLALVIAIAILLVATAIFVMRLVQRSRQTQVFPLLGRGGSVLHSPAREIVLGLTAEGLRISDAAGRAEPRTIALDEIVAVEPMSGLSALSREGIGVVTTGAPVILAGRSVQDDPAIVELRARLVDRPAG